jgi:hypothetical protein
MTHFNMVHVLPDDAQNLRAYQEVIDTVRWGLEQLGHHTSYSVNSTCAGARNIIFGGHLDPPLVVQSPDDSIYYNMEQIRGNPQYYPQGTTLLVRLIANRLQIWEYSGANMETWARLNPAQPVKLVPIGYAPVLTRIEPAPRQDIDVLIYGSVGERRLAVFATLCSLVNAGISTVFACGLFGEDRDSLIARAKIVLNVNHLTEGRIFEIVRVSYLMANAKAVVADFSPDSYVESDIANGVVLVPVDRIADVCLRLIANEDRRHRLERDGFACITRRDIRPLLTAALA